jgi:AcrR family transcriptional regulator
MKPTHNDAGRAVPNTAPARTRQRRASHGLPRRTLKRSQRQRLIDAMIELAALRGYQGVPITELCSYAGVSPVTFYEQFRSKEECFRAAYVSCAEQLFERMRAIAADGDDWSVLARRALGELLAGLEHDPDAGRLLFIEALGAGPVIEAERDRILTEFARGARAMTQSNSSAAGRPDVPLMAVIGAVRHIISHYLRIHAADRLPSLLEPGLAWLTSYSVPAASELWSTSPAALLELDAPLPSPAAWAPRTLPPGTHGLPAGVIVRSQRTRLLNATAEVMLAKGFANAKIADIVAAARVARPVFYEHFADKEQAFLEAQDHRTQFIQDCCAQAYFSADEWPQRVWRGLEALLALISANPAISHLRLVECYAAGPKAIRRAEEITRSFTIFLEEGYRYGEPQLPPPRLFSDAIAGAIFEIVRRCAAAGEWAQLPQRLPELAYIAIAPFTGPPRAVALVEEIKARERSRAPG